MHNSLWTHETEQLEFKKSPAERKTACDDIVAFANKSWWIVYLGVEDDGKILWLTKSESTTRDLTNNIKTRTSPTIHFSISWDIAEDKDIIKIIVSKSETPYHTSDGVPYIRSWSVSQKMSQQEYQSRLIKYSMPNYDFSARVINGATIEDLDHKAINELREKLKKSKRVNFEIPNDNIHLLKNLHLIQNNQITYAAIILLWTELALRKYLPYAEISYWYRLSDGDSYNQDEFIGKWWYLLYTDQLREKVDTRNLRLNIPTWLGLDTTRMAFDEETVREAINNAVIHRDYQEQSSIFVIQYTYQMKVISPGWFPDWVTIDNIADESKPRNKLLADILRRCDMVDEFGNWVNKMIKNQLKLGKNPPNYKESTDKKVVLQLDGSIADLDFAKYMIKLGDEKQRLLNDKQLTVLWKIKQWEKIQADNIVAWLIKDDLIEKASYWKYVLCKRYYQDTKQKIEYSKKKRIDTTEIIVLLNKYLSDHKEWLTKDEIMQIPLLNDFSRIYIYTKLKDFQKQWYIKMDWINKSKKTKRVLIEKIQL